jgi:hypothetical protein
MTEMKRLFDGPLSTDAARILRSAEGDAPSAPEAKQAQIIEAYGSSPLVAPRAGALAAALRARRWAALAGALLVAGYFASTQSTPGTAERRPPAMTNIAPPVAPLPPPAAVQSVRVEDLPAASEAVASAPARRAPPPLPAVEDELGAIDMARAALTGGRTSEALARSTPGRATPRRPTPSRCRRSRRWAVATRRARRARSSSPRTPTPLTRSESAQ